MQMEIKIKLSDSRYMPVYSKPGDAGADLRARTNKPLTIEPGRYETIPTGCFVELPPGWEWQIRPRSGLAFQWGISVLNSPGTIDSNYRGEVKVMLYNHGILPFTVYDGDRIAQAVLSPCCQAHFTQSEQLGQTNRGEEGFGHSGIR